MPFPDEHSWISSPTTPGLYYIIGIMRNSLWDEMSWWALPVPITPPKVIAAEDMPQLRPTTRSNGANKRPTISEPPTSRHGVGELPDKPPRIRLTFGASGPL